MNNSNKPAFPLQDTPTGNSTDGLGLTKREYFAGLAMQGFITTLPSQVPRDIEAQIARQSIKLADEILKQLESIT